MATQSNDYAFGYPILAALYGQSRPEFLPFIYLLAPVSLVRPVQIGSSRPFRNGA